MGVIVDLLDTCAPLLVDFSNEGVKHSRCIACSVVSCYFFLWFLFAFLTLNNGLLLDDDHIWHLDCSDTYYGSNECDILSQNCNPKLSNLTNKWQSFRCSSACFDNLEKNSVYGGFNSIYQATSSICGCGYDAGYISSQWGGCARFKLATGEWKYPTRHDDVDHDQDRSIATSYNSWFPVSYEIDNDDKKSTNLFSSCMSLRWPILGIMVLSHVFFLFTRMCIPVFYISLILEGFLFTSMTGTDNPKYSFDEMCGYLPIVLMLSYFWYKFASKRSLEVLYGMYCRYINIRTDDDNDSNSLSQTYSTYTTYSTYATSNGGIHSSGVGIGVNNINYINETNGWDILCTKCQIRNSKNRLNDNHHSTMKTKARNIKNIKRLQNTENKEKNKNKNNNKNKNKNTNNIIKDDKNKTRQSHLDDTLTPSTNNGSSDEQNNGLLSPNNEMDKRHMSNINEERVRVSTTNTLISDCTTIASATTPGAGGVGGNSVVGLHERSNNYTGTTATDSIPNVTKFGKFHYDTGRYTQINTSLNDSDELPFNDNGNYNYNGDGNDKNRNRKNYCCCFNRNFNFNFNCSSCSCSWDDIQFYACYYNVIGMFVYLGPFYFLLNWQYIVDHFGGIALDSSFFNHNILLVVAVTMLLFFGILPIFCYLFIFLITYLNRWYIGTVCGGYICIILCWLIGSLILGNEYSVHFHHLYFAFYLFPLMAIFLNYKSNNLFIIACQAAFLAFFISEIGVYQWGLPFDYHDANSFITSKSIKILTKPFVLNETSIKNITINKLEDLYLNLNQTVDNNNWKYYTFGEIAFSWYNDEFDYSNGFKIYMNDVEIYKISDLNKMKQLKNEYNNFVYDETNGLNRSVNVLWIHGLNLNLTYHFQIAQFSYGQTVTARSYNAKVGNVSVNNNVTFWNS